jgi:hypothetical protein
LCQNGFVCKKLSLNTDILKQHTSDMKSTVVNSVVYLIRAVYIWTVCIYIYVWTHIVFVLLGPIQVDKIFRVQWRSPEEIVAVKEDIGGKVGFSRIISGGAGGGRLVSLQSKLIPKMVLQLITRIGTLEMLTGENYIHI